MGGLSMTRRKKPPRILDLSIREIDERQDSPTSLRVITTPTTPQTPTPTRSPPETPVRIIVKTTTRMITTRVESPTAIVFVTVVPTPQTVTLNTIRTVTAQPIRSNEPQSSVAQPAQQATFTSNTGVALLAGLGGLGEPSTFISFLLRVKPNFTYLKPPYHLLLWFPSLSGRNGSAKQ
ncbi:hypothetical protein BGZ63DRAFT_404892 [Mariannaea sp. PMI_226]|nr:hypothetical protein BGZ63DRAFT_404892 [Mariannaea sp. PMI_226]